MVGFLHSICDTRIPIEIRQALYASAPQKGERASGPPLPRQGERRFVILRDWNAPAGAKNLSAFE